MMFNNTHVYLEKMVFDEKSNTIFLGNIFYEYKVVLTYESVVVIPDISLNKSYYLDTTGRITYNHKEKSFEITIQILDTPKCDNVIDEIIITTKACDDIKLLAVSNFMRTDAVHMSYDTCIDYVRVCKLSDIINPITKFYDFIENILSNFNKQCIRNEYYAIYSDDEDEDIIFYLTKEQERMYDDISPYFFTGTRLGHIFITEYMEKKFGTDADLYVIFRMRTDNQ